MMMHEGSAASHQHHPCVEFSHALWSLAGLIDLGTLSLHERSGSLGGIQVTAVLLVCCNRFCSASKLPGPRSDARLQVTSTQLHNVLSGLQVEHMKLDLPCRRNAFRRLCIPGQMG